MWCKTINPFPNRIPFLYLRYSDLESRMKDELMNVKIKFTEQSQTVAELKQEISRLETKVYFMKGLFDWTLVLTQIELFPYRILNCWLRGNFDQILMNLIKCEIFRIKWLISKQRYLNRVIKQFICFLLSHRIILITIAERSNSITETHTHKYG